MGACSSGTLTEATVLVKSERREIDWHKGLRIDGATFPELVYTLLSNTPCVAEVLDAGRGGYFRALVIDPEQFRLAAQQIIEQANETIHGWCFKLAEIWCKDSERLYLL